VFDSSLRTPFVHAIAIRYQTSLWPVGALLRGGCMAGFWTLLLWFPHRSLPRDAAMLALGTAGAVTSWAHNRPSLLDLLIDRKVVGLSHAAKHLREARKRATADLAGLLEGFGIISVGLLFAGPVEVRPLPVTVYELGLVLITIHVWSVFLQTMTDASWYSDNPPPGRTVLLLRPFIPPIVATIATVILAYPVYWLHQPVPGGLFAVALVAAVILLLLPITVVYELVLRGAAEASAVQARSDHVHDATTLHSLVKNTAYMLLREVDKDSGAGAETRSLAREMLALSEEARLTVLGEISELGSVKQLWHCVSRTLRSGGTAAVELDPASLTAKLSSTDYQLARRCLADLMTNAWKAGASQIDVGISVEKLPASVRTQTVLRVDDNGPGVSAEVLRDPATSLSVLTEHLRGYAGSLALSRRIDGGTRACVQWQSGY
jgi:signal transduction histidine kinase